MGDKTHVSWLRFQKLWNLVADRSGEPWFHTEAETAASISHPLAEDQAQPALHRWEPHIPYPEGYGNTWLTRSVLPVLPFSDSITTSGQRTCKARPKCTGHWHSSLIDLSTTSSLPERSKTSLQMCTATLEFRLCQQWPFFVLFCSVFSLLFKSPDSFIFCSPLFYSPQIQDYPCQCYNIKKANNSLFSWVR